MSRRPTQWTEYPSFCLETIHYFRETGERSKTFRFPDMRDLYTFRVKFYKFLSAIREEYNNKKIDLITKTAINLPYAFYCAKNLSVRVGEDQDGPFVTIFFPGWADPPPNLASVEELQHFKKMAVVEALRVKVEADTGESPLRFMNGEPPRPVPVTSPNEMAEMAAKIKALEAKPPEYTTEELEMIAEREKAMKGAS